MQVIHAVGLRVSISLYMYLCCILQFSAHPTSYSALQSAIASVLVASVTMSLSGFSIPRKALHGTQTSYPLHLRVSGSSPLCHSLEEPQRGIPAHQCPRLSVLHVGSGSPPKKRLLMPRRPARRARWPDSRGTTWYRQIQGRIRFFCLCSFPPMTT